MGVPRHGHSNPTPTYTSWANMKQRCLNKNHPRYSDWGGRGITVCNRWLKFENFLSDMGVSTQDMTIDRIDNSGNYEPGNCRWATATEQNANKRFYKNNTTGFKGVRVIKSTGRFTAQIRVNGKQHHLGCFRTAKEAGQAYLKASKLM